MTDDQLRALVREAVARHLGPAPGAAPGLASPTPGRSAQGADGVGHASHYQYVTIVNVGEACVIEPGVTCNHCGYCRSHGH